MTKTLSEIKAEIIEFPFVHRVNAVTVAEWLIAVIDALEEMERQRPLPTYPGSQPHD